MDYLTLSNIIEAALPEDDVELPEWGGMVKVRAITSAELERAKRQAMNRKTGELREVQLTALIVEAGCVQPEFAPGQYKLLMAKPLGPLSKISDRILELSGIIEPEAGSPGEA